MFIFFIRFVYHFRRNDDVVALVLQAGTYETGTSDGRHARRAVRV